MMETLRKLNKTRSYSDRGCGEVSLESLKQIDFMEISVDGKLKLFSWNSRDLEETFSTWNKSGIQREKDQLPHGAEELHLFVRVREPAGNETEKPQGKKHNHKSKVRPVILKGGPSVVIFKKQQ